MKTVDVRPYVLEKTAASHDGSRLAAYRYDPDAELEHVRIYDIGSERLEHTLDIHAGIEGPTHGSALAFSPDGTLLATAGKKGVSVQMWDVQSGELLWADDLPNVWAIACLALSPDGQTLAIANWDESIQLRNVRSGELTGTLGYSGHRVVTIAFSPDGSMLASGGTGPTSTVRLWDLRKGEVVATLIGHESGNHVHDLAFSPDGRYLVSVSGEMREPGEVRLWNLLEILKR